MRRNEIFNEQYIVDGNILKALEELVMYVSINYHIRINNYLMFASGLFGLEDSKINSMGPLKNIIYFMRNQNNWKSPHVDEIFRKANEDIQRIKKRAEYEGITLYCQHCSTSYTLGKDAMCMSGDDLSSIMGIATGSFHQILIITKVSEGTGLEEDAKTILKFGPSIGWQCDKCKGHNKWNR